MAEFLVNFTEKGSLYTAGQIGKEAGVSETTVIRLAYALGLNGFSDLQELMRKEWLSSAESKEAASKPAAASAAEEKKPLVNGFPLLTKRNYLKLQMRLSKVIKCILQVSANLIRQLTGCIIK
ncbi:hypothetical protein MUB15_28310 [Priestia sp. OVS21]|nr:hypothetical protein [Priestia sp. OVS21]